MEQYFYKSNMIEKNYLASYADAFFMNNKLFLINTLTDRQVMLEGEKDSLQQLLLALNRGISDEDLNLLLVKCNAEGILETLLREGLVE